MTRNWNTETEQVKEAVDSSIEHANRIGKFWGTVHESLIDNGIPKDDALSVLLAVMKQKLLWD